MSATVKLKSGKIVKSNVVRLSAHTNVKHLIQPSPEDVTYTGASIAKAYNCPTGLKGNAIAIGEYGGGWNQSDVNQAAKLAGVPVPVITDVNAGNSNSPGGDADDEVALDIQAAMGVISYMTGAPAQIYMIWADSQQSMLDAVAKLIDSGVNIGAISVSWGSDEGDGQEQSDSASIQAFTQKYGVPFCCATGDNDDGSGSTVDEPADSPYAVGCSGTTKTASSETVWNSGQGEGTGGGESGIFAMPAYQQGVIPSPATGKWRTTGDVACIGDPATGLNTVLGGQTEPIGGTSLATPVFAAIICGMGLPLKTLVWPDCLYAAKSAFKVVTGGNNNPRGSGNWPGPVCCGLGVPDGSALYKALTGAAPVQPPTTFSLSVTPTTGPAPLTVQVTGVVGAVGPITFSYGDGSEPTQTAFHTFMSPGSYSITGTTATQTAMVGVSVTPATTPPVNPNPPTGFTGTLTFVNGTLTSVIPGSQVDTIVSAALADPRVSAALAAAEKRVGTLALSGVLGKLLSAILPVILGDIAAGVPTSQIISDVIAVILKVLTGA